VYQPSVYQPSVYVPQPQPQVYPQPQPQPVYPPQPVYQPAPAAVPQNVNSAIQQLTAQLQQLQSQLDNFLRGVNPNNQVPGLVPPPPPPPPAPVPPPPPPPLPPAPVFQPQYQPQPLPQYQPPVYQPQPQPPVYRPQNVPPAPAPVAPAPAPQANPGTINLPGVQAGMNFAVDNGTVLKGYSVGGSGRVDRFDGKVIDMSVEATAMMGIVKMQLKLHGEMQADGKVHLTASKADGSPMFDETLSVVSNQPGRLELKSANGERSSLVSDGRGGITITHGQDILRLHQA
jgi:hypothetical protein